MMKIMKINLLLHESQLHKTGFDRIICYFFYRYYGCYLQQNDLYFRKLIPEKKP